MQSYDLVVIGAGPGGYVAAIRAAQLGLSVALIEKRATLGGTCLNVGCIPSKALLESSEAYANARLKLAVHGVQVGSVELDLATLLARKDQVVGEVVGGLALLMKKNKITVLHGHGHLLAADRVRVDGDPAQEIGAKAVVLASGSEPVELPFLKFDGERVVSSTEVLSFGAVPPRLAVIGAGAVGLELGSVWSRLGSEVSVIEMLPQIAGNADAQMARTLQRSLKAQGLNILTRTKVAGADIDAAGVHLHIEPEKGDPQSLCVDKVLVSVGRRAVLQGLGIEELGVKTERGKILVDTSWQTNVPGVYAIGDIIAGPMLAHKAEEEGIAVAETLAGGRGHVNYNCVPGVIYTWPELASVGKSEEQLKQEGVSYKVGRSYFKANARAKSMADDEGLVKVIADAKTDRLLGVHIVGARASDMLAEAVVAMEFGGSAEDLARSFHAHPSLSEIVKEAALAVDRRAIHG